MIRFDDEWGEGDFFDFNWFTPESGGLDTQLAQDAARVTAPIQVPWPQLKAAFRLALGDVRLVTRAAPGTASGTATYIQRRMGLLCPYVTDYSGRDWLYATSIARTEGVAWRGNEALETLRPATYEFGRIYLVFGGTPYDVKSDANLVAEGFTEGDELGLAMREAAMPDEASLGRFVSFGGDAFDRSITVPRALMRVVREAGDPDFGTGKPPEVVMESMGVPDPGLEISWIHHLRPDVPWANILTTMGSINATAFGGIKAGQGVMLAPKIRAYRSSLGRKVYDVTFRAKAHSRVNRAGVRRDLNYFLRYIDGPTPKIDLRLLTSSGLDSGERLFQPKEWRLVFRPDQPVPAS